MNQSSEPLPANYTYSEIRYRPSVRYLMLMQIAELHALKLYRHFPLARFALRDEVISRLNTLGGLAGEW
ncbi:hypothetical protein [Burkholderia pseudomallei]|uniref:hypothetical protein n=1 Tax=Burkholderia pseudomallei TaxID=28450 RepID=UPI0008FF0F73|nr:hypothetical protein [Burkholderia pseudomallei]APD36821.1 hypothetical protein BK015_17825 [Burkholderia pseudomallei]ARK39682.1 hypothetical protein BOC60_05345 [Burkholderia pseudomallei]ARL58918.1 hypothetical protein BOC52_20315 [Burkholderia pseudomallei]ARL65334.1 hypothetical protein BOC53_17400 [Burkholderia pseudomallei]